MLKRAILLLLIILTALIAVQAYEPVTTTAHRRVTLHAGPGHTFTPNDVLNPGLEIQIIERNAVGTWIRVQRLTPEGNIAQDGWLMLGYLNIPDDLRFSDVPVNRDLPDADPDNIDSRSMRQLYTTPVIPAISEAMRDVFERGQALDRQPNVVTKVGDSLSADPGYLQIMSVEERALGPFDYLEPTIRYYGASTSTDSVAARIGLSSLVVFDPFWADSELCAPRETPLTCEYRLKNPSVALIMFGPNDVLSMTYEEYGANIRQITEDTLNAGIIPVLSTFSYSPEHEYWWQSVEFNLQIVEIANEYDVPLINLWAASRPLPEYGMDIDNIHMKQSGFNYLKFDSGHETWYGTSLRNLLAIRTLHEIRLALELGD